MDVLSRLWRLARTEFYSAWGDRARHAEGPAGAPAAGPAGRPPGGERPDGSPPRPPPRDARLAQYYANLEIPYGSDLATVRRAWKRLLKLYHPDLHGDDPERRRTATELTAALNTAFRELESALRRDAAATE